MPMYCFQVDSNAPLVVSKHPGKRAFVTEGKVVPAGLGLNGADAFCNAEAKAANLDGSYKALLASSTASAASRFIPAQQYVRPDGQVVGSGNVVFGSSVLMAGLWQTAAGDYVSVATKAEAQVWIGAPSLTEAGTFLSTCANWTSTTPTANVGLSTYSSTQWYSDGTAACTSSKRLYCIEE
jgi:hypothetical protein